MNKTKEAKKTDGYRDDVLTTEQAEERKARMTAQERLTRAPRFDESGLDAVNERAAKRRAKELAAAAIEMLAALIEAREYVSRLGDRPGESDCAKRIAAAIARAEGK